jgi:hypothetical protein
MFEPINAGVTAMVLWRLAGIILGLLVAETPNARAEEFFPSRLITIVTPLTPGTTIDILARLFADRLARHFAQPVVVIIVPAPPVPSPDRRSQPRRQTATRCCSPILATRSLEF